MRLLSKIPKHDSRAVANYFIKKQQKIQSGFILTAPILEKVVYLAHALHTKEFNKGLCDKPPLESEYEPYFVELRDALELTGNQEVPKLIRDEDSLETYLFGDDSPNKIFVSNFTNDQRRLLDILSRQLNKHEMRCHHLSFFTDDISAPDHPDKLSIPFKEVKKEQVKQKITEAMAA